MELVSNLRGLLKAAHSCNNSLDPARAGSLICIPLPRTSALEHIARSR